MIEQLPYLPYGFSDANYLFLNEYLIFFWGESDSNYIVRAESFTYDFEEEALSKKALML
jgi:hypothetical protein